MSKPAVTLDFAGHRVELTPDGLIWIPRLKLLAAADIHFEKGSFFSRFTTFLPPYDTLENLARLQRIVDHYRPDLFIAVGDSFHDRAAALRIPCGSAGTAECNHCVRVTLVLAKR